MNSDQFLRHLVKLGCTVERGDGKGGHVKVWYGGRFAIVPTHGGRKQLRTGLMNTVLKQLELKWAEEETVQYPVDLSPDEGTLLVRFPDVPEAISFGDDEADALLHGRHALEMALQCYVDERRDLPVPSPADGRPTVAPTLLVAMKLEIYRAMRARGWRKADLARAMALSPRQIERLFDFNVASTVAQLDAALAALGREARVETVELAA